MCAHTEWSENRNNTTAVTTCYPSVCLKEYFNVLRKKAYLLWFWMLDKKGEASLTSTKSIKQQPQAG